MILERSYHTLAIIAFFSACNGKTSYFNSQQTALLQPSSKQSQFDASNQKTLPNVLYGVTTDNGYDTIDLPLALKSLSKKPITRIVYDEFVSAIDYIAGTTAIKDVSYVMAQPVDSSSMSSYTLQQYENRFLEFWYTLAPNVDVWEIGNEINGEWTGEITVVVSKLNAAYDIIKSRGGKTAVTLYYNTPCSPPAEREMFNWVSTNMADTMRTGLDYVFISYYEDDCPGPSQDWNAVFKKLADIFPNSNVGFGEIGTKNTDKKKSLLADYYQLSKPGNITEPRYVGAYFYWYFYDDMVPKSKPLWTYFDEILKNLP